MISPELITETVIGKIGDRRRILYKSNHNMHYRLTHDQELIKITEEKYQNAVLENLGIKKPELYKGK